MMPRGSMVFRDGDLNTKTGRIERWVGLDRRAHRYLCYSMSFLFVMMTILIGIGFGFVIFPLLFSLFTFLMSYRVCWLALCFTRHKQRKWRQLMDIKAEGLTDNQTKIVPSFKSDGCVCACVGCIRLNCGVVIMRKYESR